MAHWFYWGSTAVCLIYMSALISQSKSYIRAPAVFFCMLLCFMPVINSMLALAIVVAIPAAIGSFLSKGKF